MAFTPQNSGTPTKLSKTVNISPKTKTTVCLVCGNDVKDVNYRRRLFRGDTKTDICLLFEKYLEANISIECSTNIVCKKCQLHLWRARDIIDKLRTSYHQTVSRLYDTHGSETKKRLLNEDCEQKPARRKTLFPTGSDLSGASCIGKETSDITVSIPSQQHGHFTVAQTLFPLLTALKTSDFCYISTVALDIQDVRVHVLKSITKQLTKEIAGLCGKNEPSILRKNDKSTILNLTWDSIVSEWKTKAPLYWSFLEIFISNPALQLNKLKDAKSLIPGLVTAGSKLISLYNQQLSLVQHLNSIILLQGGAKKSLFNRLNATHDSLSYNATINQVERFASDWPETIKLWKEHCERDGRRERQLQENIAHTRGEMLEYGATPDKIFYLAGEQEALLAHRKQMHKGYYFVGDNVDFYTRVRHMSYLRQNQSQHMFQMCAYKNRVSGNNLDDTSPKDDINAIPFKKFIPNDEDRSKLAEEFAYFVAKAWAQHIPCFQSFAAVLPKFIPHENIQETKKKTERIPLGVLQKNEQFNDQMTDIAEFLHQFVPGHSEDLSDRSRPQKVLSGGDYLTFERQKQAHHALGDGPTPNSRLQGLVPKMEEFHNQAEFLKVIWKHLYSSSSNKSVGTLHAARSTINAVNVTQDPHDNFYPCSEFMDKVTTAYIVTGGLHHFQMEHLTSVPTPNYVGAVGNPYEMIDYFLGHAKQFVDKHVLPEVPQLPAHGLQSNTLACRYCGKLYQRPKALRKHEARLHGHSDPEYNAESNQDSTSSAESRSSVYQYTRLSLMLGLLRMNHNDSIHMGDGGRMMRLVKWFCLYYKASKCPKYAYGLLETQAKAYALLSERQAYRLIWNRTVNHQGRVDTNHPNDLDLEHCNRAFKDGVHTYKGRYTDKTILRVSRSALSMAELCKKYDKLAFCKQSSGRHGVVDPSGDILKLVEQFHAFAALFNEATSHCHREFKNMQDPLSSLNMSDIQNWISESLKVFSSRTYYDI